MTKRLGGRLGDLKVHIDDAQEKFETDKATLYRSDGSQMFSEDEHKERLDALTRERNTTLKQAEEDVREEMIKLDERVEHVKARDIAELLDGEELRAAGDRRAFAIDASETLGTGELASRMRSVLATGDKGAIFAYLNAGERKRRELVNARPAGRAGASSATDLDSVLAEMRKVLNPNAESEIEAAKERKEKAVQLQVLAGNLQQGARNSAQVYINQAYGDVAERLGLKKA